VSSEQRAPKTAREKRQRLQRSLDPNTPGSEVAATKEQRHPDESAMNGAVAQKKKERRRKACLQ